MNFKKTIKLSMLAATLLFPLKSFAEQPTFKFTPLLNKSLVTFNNFQLVKADMSGWTALTNGAAKGGGSISSDGTYTILAVRGGDNDIYLTPFNPNSFGLIDSSAWTGLGINANSEPQCSAFKVIISSVTNHNIKCLYLGATGNALIRGTAYDGKSFAQIYLTQDNMGGKNAGAAPSFLAAPDNQALQVGTKTYMNLAVWDGAKSLFVKRAGEGFSISGSYIPDGVTDWKKLNFPVEGPVGCYQMGGSFGQCALTVDGKRIRVIKFNDAESEPSVNAVSPDYAGGVNGRPTIASVGAGKFVVAVRAGDGKLIQIVYNSNTKSFVGGWKSEGGFVTKGSSPSCVGVGSNATCVIQGADGKLYAKKLSNSASGL